MWCGAESNRRHKDFQSFALPTELPHLDDFEIADWEIGKFLQVGNPNISLSPVHIALASSRDAFINRAAKIRVSIKIGKWDLQHLSISQS